MHVENPLLRRAELLLEQRRYDMAEQQLRQAIAADPNVSLAYSYLAICLAEREAWAEATEAARRAISLAPDDPHAHYALARVYFDRNMFEDAHASIDEAIRLDPHTPAYWALLASLSLAEKRWRDALEAAERGLEVDPEHEACINIRAMALTNLGDRAAAAAAIDATLARNPENAVTHANLGWTRLHEGRPRDAMEHFREALRLDPESEWARAGIVEAMKARSFVYRIFLAYFLFMRRLRGRAQWAIVIGGYLGVRALLSASQSNPSLDPVIMPIIVAYIAFAMGTVVAVPLFNLFLFASPFGRHALNPDQRRGAMIFGLALVPPLTFLVLWAIDALPGMMWTSLFTALWVVPVSLATLAPRAIPRVVMSCVAAILALACVGLCYSIIAIRTLPPENTLVVYAISCAGSTWIANIVGSFKARPKR